MPDKEHHDQGSQDGDSDGRNGVGIEHFQKFDV